MPEFSEYPKKRQGFWARFGIRSGLSFAFSKVEEEAQRCENQDRDANVSVMSKTPENSPEGDEKSG
jgi:hypothetical protein